MAGETVLDLDFETGNFSKFDSFFEHSSTQRQVVQTPLRSGWGNYVARVQVAPGDTYSGTGNVMCLMARTNSNEAEGQTYYFAMSMRIPSGPNNFGTDTELLWELHHKQPLYSLSAAAGVAPWAIFYHDPDTIRFRINTGDAFNNGSLNNGYTHAELNINLIVSPPRDQWIDFIVGIFFTESSTGWCKVWYDLTGTATFTAEGSPQLSRTSIPTLPYCSNPSVHNQSLYTQIGLYTGTSSVSTVDQYWNTGSRRKLSYAAAVAAFTQGGGAPPPPPPTTRTGQWTTPSFVQAATTTPPVTPPSGRVGNWTTPSFMSAEGGFLTPEPATTTTAVASTPGSLTATVEPPGSLTLNPNPGL